MCLKRYVAFYNMLLLKEEYSCFYYYNSHNKTMIFYWLVIGLKHMLSSNRFAFLLLSLSFSLTYWRLFKCLHLYSSYLLNIYVMWCLMSYEERILWLYERRVLYVMAGVMVFVNWLDDCPYETKNLKIFIIFILIFWCGLMWCRMSSENIFKENYLDLRHMLCYGFLVFVNWMVV